MLQRARVRGAPAVRGTRLDFVVVEAQALRSLVRLIVYEGSVLAGAIVRGSQVLYTGQRFSATIASIRTEPGVGGAHLVFVLTDLCPLGFSQAPSRKGTRFELDGKHIEYLAPVAESSLAVWEKLGTDTNQLLHPKHSKAVKKRTSSIPKPHTVPQSPNTSIHSLGFSPKKERRVAFGAQARRLLAASSVTNSRRKLHAPSTRKDMLSTFRYDARTDVETMLAGIKSILYLSLPSIDEPARADIDSDMQDIEEAPSNQYMSNPERYSSPLTNDPASSSKNAVQAMPALRSSPAPIAASSPKYVIDLTKDPIDDVTLKNDTVSLLENPPNLELFGDSGTEPTGRPAPVLKRNSNSNLINTTNHDTQIINESNCTEGANHANSDQSTRPASSVSKASAPNCDAPVESKISNQDSASVVSNDSLQLLPTAPIRYIVDTPIVTLNLLEIERRALQLVHPQN